MSRAAIVADVIRTQARRILPVPSSERIGQEMRIDRAACFQNIDDRKCHRRVVSPPPRGCRDRSLLDERIDDVRIHEESFAERVADGQTCERKSRSLHADSVICWQHQSLLEQTRMSFSDSDVIGPSS